MLNYCVYIHTRLDTNEVFYVGKGVLNRPHKKHGRNNHWQNIVNKCGYKASILGLFKDEQNAFEYEKKLISDYRNKGIKLTNMTNGGEGISGLVFSKDHKEKISQKVKGKLNPMYGKESPYKGVPRSEEVKKKISMATKGKVRSEEHRLKLSLSLKGRIAPNKGKKMSEEQKMKISATKRSKNLTFFEVNHG